MKKFITILIGCSLTLAAGLRAEQEDPTKKPVQKSKPVQKQPVNPNQFKLPKSSRQINPQHPNPTIQNNPKIYNNNVPKHQYQTVPSVQPNTLPAVQSNKWQTKKAPVIQPNQVPSVQPNNKWQSNKVPVVPPNQVPGVQPNKWQTNKVPGVPPNQVPGVNPNKFPINRNVNNFNSKHLNFHAQPNPAIVSARYNQHYRIHGAENWHGNQYNAFRTYHPQWHDRGWWHSHHNHIVLIGGGWYFWNAGYWYPAWGYDDAAAYYPYDGPIYVGNSPRALDQVVADVQTTLQEQGYYNGEVDGLVGPLTQEALAAFQTAQGLEPTAAIDEPTLAALGLS